MRRTILGALAGVILSSTSWPVLAGEGPVPLYSWTKMEWQFRSADEKAAFDKAQVYARAPLAGVEADPEGNIYVSTPRWLDPAVPSTLSRVDMVDGKPMLVPFPSWEAHDLSDPNAIRNALGVFVDSQSRMWIVDMGFVAGEKSVPDGAQKLIGIDLKTGKEFVRYAIPDDVADRNTSFLNDLVVDEKNNVIYITDSGNRGGGPVPAGLIVYDIASNTARRVLDRDPSVQDDPNLWLKIDGERVFTDSRLAVGINGVTISADGETVYWTVTTADAIYSVPTKLLRDPAATPEQISAAVEGPLQIGGGSDGMATDPSGRLWITNIALNRVEVLAPEQKQTDILFEGPDFIWPDSLASDFKGNMLLTTNHLNHAFEGKMNYDGDNANFRVWRIPADMKPVR